MNREKSRSNFETGDFPYALTDGSESRHLTWIRNHSNYMAERGFVDSLNLVAALVRGILVNLWVALAPLLTVSLVLGLAYYGLLAEWNMPPVTLWPSTPTSYRVTPIALWFAIGSVFLVPIGTRVFRATTDSKNWRNRFKRSYGAVLLLSPIAFALIETLPHLVHIFHQLRVNGGAMWTLPTLAVAVGLMVALNTFLPLLYGLARILAMLLAGFLGLLIMLVVVLFAVEFLVYAEPYEGLLNEALFFLPLSLAIGIVIATVIGSRTFREKADRKLFALFAAMVALFFAVVALVFFFRGSTYFNFIFVLAWTVEIWVLCSLSIDVNLTSIHGLYRDRVASAYLVGRDPDADVDRENAVVLQEICQYDAGSTAPYHIVNVALNLQGSMDIAIRERNCDFFIFSKRYIGSDRTGYCRSENMERVYPPIDLGTAMMISAAAASPNMGRSTNALMVAFMTLLNVRLGFWTPNPGRLEKFLADGNENFSPPGFAEVFKEELGEIELRREQAYGSKSQRPLAESEAPTIEHNLVGIGFSGGGIRSATINLGIAQALHKAGVFDHIDHMSTVSGGGYLGSSISSLMRYKLKPVTDIDGTVKLETTDEGEKIVSIQGEVAEKVCIYRYPRDATLDDGITEGARVKAGQRIIKRHADLSEQQRNTLIDRLQWRVRPVALMREMLSMFDETHKWVNLSDGGHIENLGLYELLRRRCKYIVACDAEADPYLNFNGLVTLMRHAKTNLGIEIDIPLDRLTIRENGLSSQHCAVGRITYPDTNSQREHETGYLLYIKSSCTGDEGDVITEYRHRNPDFPHEATADQFFDEGQFEAYRALGFHAADGLFDRDQLVTDFASFERWFLGLDADLAPAAGGIFICYRRADTEGYARLIKQLLSEHIGDDSVFMDVGGIDYGADIQAIIDGALSKCRIVLVLIGTSWFGAKSGIGEPDLLSDPDDYVRQEIQRAFELRKRIMPILVQGALMPRPNELPVEIRELSFQNAVNLPGKPDDSDLQDLVNIVDALFE